MISIVKGKMTGLWILVALLAAPRFVQAQTSVELPLIHAGKSHLLDGELDQAIQNFSEQLRIHGYNRDAYYWRAHCLIKQGFIDDALEDLRLILQNSPDDSKAMDAIGYANNQRGQYLEAINWFNKAITQDHENAVIYNNRGMSFYYLEKYPSAFHDFNYAVRLDSTFAEAYSNRGSARYNNQNIAAATEIDLRKAEADFSRALELDNSLVSAYRNRGIVRFQMKKYTESFLDLQKAIYLQPDDPIIYLHMGNLMMARQEYREAVNYFGDCLKRNPRMTEALYNRALAYIQLDQFDLARYDYEIILDHNQDQRGACFFLIAKTYAYEDKPKLVYSALNQARKHGYFKSDANRNAATSDALFKPYWDEPDFQRLLEKIRKG